MHFEVCNNDKKLIEGDFELSCVLHLEVTSYPPDFRSSDYITRKGHSKSNCFILQQQLTI